MKMPEEFGWETELKHGCNLLLVLFTEHCICNYVPFSSSQCSFWSVRNKKQICFISENKFEICRSTKIKASEILPICPSNNYNTKHHIQTFYTSVKL